MAKRRLPRGDVSPTLTPIGGPEAFSDLRDPSHIHSQAATLLLIGSSLRGDVPAMQARAAAVQPFTAQGPARVWQPVPTEDLQRLSFPVIQASADRFAPGYLQQKLGVRFAQHPATSPRPRDIRAVSQTLPQAADAFYSDANPETAAALLEASLHHPQELVRVSAASSYLDAVATGAEAAIRVLERGLSSRDSLTRSVAAHALAHIQPNNPKLQSLLRSRKSPSKLKRSRTSTIIHGTFARTQPWWQPPKGDFWIYMHSNVDPSLYGAADRFEWSGGYSDAARVLGGTDLYQWLQRHKLDGLDLFTHSHGGSVAMLANHASMRIGRLVLLSCPVHWPKYTPDFTLVKKVVSIRVHLDLVILADRGGQKFSDSRIQENVLPVWFNHFATHDPKVWQRYNVPGMI